MSSPSTLDSSELSSSISPPTAKEKKVFVMNAKIQEILYV